MCRLRAFGLNPLTATRDDLERYLESRRLSSPSMLTNIADLSSFYSWAVDEGFVESNPLAKMVRPRPHRYHPRPAASSDLATAVELADDITRAMLLLAALGGFRCMEVAGLRWSDVDLGGAMVTVRGKGGHERIVDLHPVVVSALAVLPREGGTVFVGFRHGANHLGGERQPYTPNRVSKRINEYLHSLGIHSTAHQLRHWYGTELYRSTKDLRMVQSLMGHASPATTAVYTAFDRSDSKKATDELTFGPAMPAQSALF